MDDSLNRSEKKIHLKFEFVFSIFVLKICCFSFSFYYVKYIFSLKGKATVCLIHASGLLNDSIVVVFLKFRVLFDKQKLDT